MNTHNKFKDAKGRWLTQGLFFETAQTDKYLVYTLRDECSKGLPSLKHLYLDMLDYTEYRFANKHLGGWEHWQRLCDNALIGREIAKWREELEVKLVAEGLLQITDIARDETNKGRLTAARFLAERGFKPKESVGRPTKKQIEAKKGLDNKVADAVMVDLDRIRNLQ